MKYHHARFLSAATAFTLDLHCAFRYDTMKDLVIATEFHEVLYLLKRLGNIWLRHLRRGHTTEPGFILNQVLSDGF